MTRTELIEQNRRASELRRPFVEKRLAEKLKALTVTAPTPKADCPHCATAQSFGKVIFCGVCMR